MGTYSKLLNIEKENDSSPVPSTAAKPVKIHTEKNKQLTKSRHQARNQETNKDSNQEIKISRFLDFAAPALDEKPTHMQSFKYPSIVLELLDDLTHDLKKKERKQTKKPKWRATKTTVFILSVLFLIWDYKESKEDSILHRVIFEGR